MTIENTNIDVVYNDLTADLYNLYKKSSYLAIDTEAMGLIHGRDRLCLVQICSEFKRTSCIKIGLNTSSSPHLKALLEDEKITKIFHYARFDVAALKCNLKINTKNIFCTKIAKNVLETTCPLNIKILCSKSPPVCFHPLKLSHSHKPFKTLTGC